MTENYVEKILETVAANIEKGLSFANPSEQLVLLAAKEMGLIVGKRGIGGGYFPTDEGLVYIEEDVAEYHAQQKAAEEAAEASRKDAEKNRKAKKQEAVVEALAELPEETRQKVMTALFGAGKTWPLNEKSDNQEA